MVAGKRFAFATGLVVSPGDVGGTVGGLVCGVVAGDVCGVVPWPVVFFVDVCVVP